MIVDSSAVVAVLAREDDAERFEEALERPGRLRISAASLLEICRVAKAERFELVDAFVDDLGIEVVPFDRSQALLAREAFTRYGKGSGSPANLNFGDCMTYALAKVTGEPLLFKGDDFIHTDITPVL